MTKYVDAIRRAYPDLVIESATLTEWSGQNNDVLLVNDALIFRFPKYQFGVEVIESEVALLNRLRPHITLPIPDPRYHNAGSVGESFIGYPMLPGRALKHEYMHALDDATQQRIAAQLGNYLREIHAIPLDLQGMDRDAWIGRMQITLSNLFDIPIADLDFTAPVNDGERVIRGMYNSFRRHLYPHMREDAREQTTAYFENYFATPALHAFKPSWRHGDFGGENILFDGENVTGIIDFSFTGIGNPALDIAAISTYGDRFFSKLLEYYPETADMLDQARFYRGIFALEEALHGILHNDPQAFESGIAEYR